MKIGPLHISLTRKAASASLPFAMAQDNVLTSIGDAASNYISDGYQKNPNLFSIIKKMSSSALKAKIELYDVTDRNKITLIEDNPLIDLLHRPSPRVTKKSFMEAAYAYKWITGERFIYKVRSDFGKNTGKVGWLIAIPPQFIKKINLDATGQIMNFEFQQGAKNYTISADDMIYDRYFNPDGGIRGQSPLLAGREILAHNNDIIKANRKLTRNMGPDSIVQLGDGSAGYAQEQIDAFEEKYKDKYTGANNYGRRMFTSEKVTNIPLGAKADDIGIFEASTLTLGQLCNIYGISSILFNDNENTTYNNILQAHKSMITEVILPEVDDYISSLNHQLVPDFAPDGKTWEFRINKTAYEELKADLLTEVQALAAAFWLTINERRKAMGYEELDIPAGDEIFLPVNTEPISVKADAIASLSNAESGAAK